MFGKMISDMMVKPFQSPLFDDPANYGLAYENVTFEASDGVVLKGWLIKGGTDRVIIQSHFGVQCNRAGYCPEGKGLIKPWKKNISFLRQARYLVDQGYSVLMYDLRNHGESGLGTMPWVSWGSEEAKDVIAAVDYITNQRPEYRQADIGLLSICMGAASSTYAFAVQNGLRHYQNIKAMIAVQPLQYKYFVDAFGMPGFLERAGSKETLERTGLDLGKTSFLSDAAHVSVPTLIVQNKNDPWTNLQFVQDYFDTLPTEKQLMWLDLEKNRFAAYDHIGRAPQELLGWFDRFMGVGGQN